MLKKKGHKNFAALRRCAKEGVDYAIEWRLGMSGIAVMAPHGGGIEPGTDIIADAVAGQIHTYYAFKGLRQYGNRELHLPSQRFDEPRALSLARNSRTVLTIHGCRDAVAAAFLGGRDEQAKEFMAGALAKAGCRVIRNPRSALQGVHPDNLCNLGRKAKGIQLEISFGLRQRLLPKAGRGVEPAASCSLRAFIRAVNGVLAMIG